jgi:hypothetical protein
MPRPIRSKLTFILPLLLAFLLLSVFVLPAGPLSGEAAPAGKDNTDAKTPDAAEERAKPKPAPLSRHVAEYHIGVSYDAKKHLLTGEQTVTWRHPGKKPVQELYFHLYPNAFRSPETTFMKESGGQLRGVNMKPGSFGSMTVSSVKSMNGEDWSHRLAFVQPDDGNREDRTLAKLRLPHPVMPGETVTLRLQFTVSLPRVFARMGVADDFLMAGQWYPKVAAYETAGTRGREEEGWSLHQYHGNSEFYGNFGIYNVTINVPDDHLVAATGFQAKPVTRSGGRKTYHFYADDVHDFAWAASPHFVYAEEPHADRFVPGVKIKLYLDPRHAHLKDRYFRAAKLSLSRYGEWFGPYPYSTLSIVVPPADAEGAGGMEYPTLIAAWAAESEQPGLELEQVVAHEIAHQYWYGIVASNEAEEAWLDEAFASWSEFRLMQTEYGKAGHLKYEAVSLKDPAPLKLASWKFTDHEQYAANVYTRGKLVLLAIEREIGTANMRKVLKTYYERWKFKHPGTADFQRVLEDVTKRSWQSFFDQFVHGKEMLDYEVAEIRSREVEKNGRKLREYTVKLVRHGGYFKPVPVMFRFADGTVAEKVWEDDGREKVIKVTTDSRLLWVAVDPDQNLLLENRLVNNVLLAEIDNAWKVRWTVLIGKMVETLLGWAI